MTVTAFLKKSNLTCQTEGMNIITMDLCTFSVAALDEQRDHIQFGRTEYKIHLLSYIRLRWTTSEFTGRLQNLLDDFRIYWTTSDFYWTTWVLEVKISSATWPGGSVLYVKSNGNWCCTSPTWAEVQFRSSWSPTRRSQVGLQLRPDGLDWSCTRWTSVDSTQGHLVQVQVQLGFASLDFNLTEIGLQPK